MKTPYKYWAIQMLDGHFGCLRTEEWCSDFDAALGPMGAFERGKVVPVSVKVRKITPHRNSNKPTVAQKEFLRRHKIDLKGFKTKGECSAAISRILFQFKHAKELKK